MHPVSTNQIPDISGFELNIESVSRNSKSRQGNSGNFGNLTALDALKLHSPCIFQNITMCLAKRNMHYII